MPARFPFKPAANPSNPKSHFENDNLTSVQSHMCMGGVTCLKLTGTTSMPARLVMREILKVCASASPDGDASGPPVLLLLPPCTLPGITLITSPTRAVPEATLPVTMRPCRKYQCQYSSTASMRWKEVKDDDGRNPGLAYMAPHVWLR